MQIKDILTNITHRSFSKPGIVLSLEENKLEPVHCQQQCRSPPETNNYFTVARLPFTINTTNM